MCKFTLADMRIIGTALKSNRVLRGIHSLGNEGTVDSRGFLLPKKKPVHTQRLHLPNRMAPLRAATNNRKSGHLRNTHRVIGSSCWLCGQWRSQTFYWTVGKSEGAAMTRRQLGILREIFHRYLQFPFDADNDEKDEEDSEDARTGSTPSPRSRKRTKDTPESLDPACLETLFSDLNIKITTEKISDLFALFDDGDRRVSLPELVAVVSRAIFLQDSSTGAVPARVLLVTDFGSTYVNEEPVDMTYDSKSRSFSVSIMVPPTRVSYFFVVNGQPRTAADQLMESPQPESTEAKAKAYKIKTETMRAAIFPNQKTLALRNFVHIAPAAHFEVAAFHALRDWEKPRQPRKPVEVKSKGKEAEWTLKNSVFAGFKDETDALMEKCFEDDWRRIKSKMRRFIKDPDELEAVKDIFEEHYVDLCNAFKHALCSCGDEGPFSLQIMPGLADFNESTRIIDGPGSGVSLSDLDTIFIATNYTEKKVKNNPDRAIVRYQWMEYIARCAIAKYSKPAIPGEEPLNPPLALDVLMESNVIPLATQIDSLALRHDFLWKSDTDRVYRDFLEDADKLFKQFARSINPPAMVGLPLALSLPELLSLVSKVRLFRKLPNAKPTDPANEVGQIGGKGEKKQAKKQKTGGGLDNAQVGHVTKIFVASKMVYRDPLTARNQKDLTRVEFLETLGRIAEYRIKLSTGQLDKPAGGNAAADPKAQKVTSKKKKGKKNGKKGKKKKGKKKRKKKKKKNGKQAAVAAVINLLPRPGEQKEAPDSEQMEGDGGSELFQPTISKGDMDAFLEALTET